MSGAPPTLRRVWLPYLVDVAGPFLAYVVVQRFGLAAVWALTAGGGVAAISTTVNTIRRKGLDRVGILVLLELGVSIAVLLGTRDPRLLLVRPSFYTGAAACYLLTTLAGRRPLTFDGAKVMAAQGGPARLAAYERAWDDSAEFRRTHVLVTLAFALVLAVDSVLRVLIVFRTPVTRAAWLSNVPHVVGIVLFVAVSALAGRRFARIVDGEMARHA